jgi:ubiquinone/menaquinone biosynthesis C-methylase UbiE
METASPVPRFDSNEVRRYYERHTSMFLSFGQGGRVGALRRAVWGPGVTSREQAFNFVNDRITQTLEEMSQGKRLLNVFDLGCGVGASLCYIATRVPLRGTGITLSPLQARLATTRIKAVGLTNHVSCVVGDFCAIPTGIASADAAYAIEAFNYSPTAAHFFREAARLIKPGGFLVICDDFVRVSRNAKAMAAVEQFRIGWRLNTLLTPEETCIIAQRNGFKNETTTDLTPWLDFNRPRDRALALLAGLLGRIPLAAAHFDFLIGGNSLRRCLVHGWIEYNLLLFRRTG